MTHRVESVHFGPQHERLEAQFLAHLLDVVAGDFVAALEQFQHWMRALEEHIEVENTLLLPHLPDDARWPARLYLLEHERILLLAREYQLKVKTVAEQPPPAGKARHQAALDLIDAAHALRHLSEHHHQREEMALEHELPAELQQAAWGTLARSDES